MESIKPLVLALVPYAWLIPLLPAAAFLLIIFFGYRFFFRGSAYVACLSTVASFILSAAVFVHLILEKAAAHGEHAIPAITQTFTWIADFVPGALDHTGAPLAMTDVVMGVSIDLYAAIMLMVVSGIASLTIFYSIGYMWDDKRYSRFFAYKAFFAFSMLGLVAAPNFFQMFVFWELVGAASYFLIGFWFEKDSASDAGKKAFITNRVGDVGFLAGILLLYYFVGTVAFSDLTEHLLEAKGFEGAMATVIVLLIFCGAMGKSAQFPLHVWLPDAMEGPTSVSALIHSATMVAAGVYMIVRAYAVFAASETALLVIAAIGVITAMGAAYIALTQTDIKRILAYSTLSQLGYMVFACGCLGPVAAFFHLVTHACFKSLLFLGSGSVIHGMHHEQDIRHMGALRRYMPVTTWTFLIASLALAGVFPMAGFFSKDEIMLAAWHRFPMIFVLGEIVAVMTAFYIFRLFFVTFTGKFRGHGHPHESPISMLTALVILAILSIGVGFLNWPLSEHPWFASQLHYLGGEHQELNLVVVGISTGAAALGILLAYLRYFARKTLPPAEYSRAGFWYRLSLNKFYVDEFYKKYLIDGFTHNFAARGMFDFDRLIVDGFVNLCGRSYVLLSSLHGLFDRYVVDGLVNFTAWMTQLGSLVFRRTQTGVAQNYMLMIVAGLLALLFWSALYVGAAM